MANLLTAKDIYEKDFKSGLRGYNAVEVDAFLDEVMADYEYFEKEMQLLKQEHSRLVQRIKELESSSQPVQTPTETIALGNTNLDVLKRLSNLERHVFGEKLNNN